MHRDYKSLCLPLMQVVRAADIYTPEEFKHTVIMAFDEIARACVTKISCEFKELMAILDWESWFKGQDPEAWPNEISNFRARDDTVHSARFQGRTKARADRP